MPKKTEADESPLDRALAIIAPSKDQREDCRQDLQLTVDIIANTPVRRTMAHSMQFAALAKALRDMHKAIKKLDFLDQSFLLAKPPFNRPLRESSSVVRDIEAFMKELDQAAALIAEQSENVKVPAAERARDRQKLVTADCAYWLLVNNGKPPTVTDGGAFVRLANVLYEAVTGDPDADLRYQCRVISAKQKQK
jgi:hypothetical protein